jgi:hypothetical protein
LPRYLATLRDEKVQEEAGPLLCAKLLLLLSFFESNIIQKFPVLDDIFQEKADVEQVVFDGVLRIGDLFPALFLLLFLVGTLRGWQLS